MPQGAWIKHSPHADWTGLLFGINNGLLCRLQSVLNVAAHLVTGARRCDHATPLMKQLHRLPIRQRVVFMIAELVHQSLAGVAPLNLDDDCLLFSECGRSSFQSSSHDIRTLVVPQTHNKFGDRSFWAVGRQVWNDLPPKLRSPQLSFDCLGIIWLRHYSTVALSNFYL